MKYLVSVVFLYCLLGGDVNAAELQQITWKTPFAAEAVKLSRSQESLLPLIRLGVAAFPESTIMKLRKFKIEVQHRM